MAVGRSEVSRCGAVPSRKRRTDVRPRYCSGSTRSGTSVARPGVVLESERPFALDGLGTIGG